MSMQKGSDFILKIGDGAEIDEAFMVIGAATTTAININNNVLDITALNSNGFRELQQAGAVKSISIDMEGIAKDNLAAEILCDAALANQINNYQFIFPNGDYIESAFAISLYKKQGVYNGLEIFSLKLESSGAYNITKGE